MKLSLFLSSLLLTLSISSAYAACPDVRNKELKQRRDAGAAELVSSFINGADVSNVHSAFQSIAVSETYLIVHECLTAADPYLLMRDLKISNEMDVAKASYTVFAKKVKADLGINLQDVREIFSQTIYVRKNGGSYVHQY